jgi:HD-like signal output (HDOD) protein
MFRWLVERLRGSRDRPSRIAIVEQPRAPAPADPTLTEVLSQLVTDLGGPVTELDRDVWCNLALQVEERACEMPRPPAFPAIATQMINLARQPDADLNRVVGIVQRDGGIATALLRTANSAAFAPAVPVVSIRDALHLLGMSNVVSVVLGTAGRSYYQVASPAELRLFPELWQTMFNDAMANGFTAGRLALDVPGARGEQALLAGLLSDVGRPIALKLVIALIRDGHAAPALPLVLATLDEVAPAIGRRVISAMELPDELRAACIPDVATSSDACIAQLVAAIGAMQRRSPRIWVNASEVRLCAETLGIKPRALRTVFAQRTQYGLQATAMFS